MPSEYVRRGIHEPDQQQECENRIDLSAGRLNGHDQFDEPHGRKPVQRYFFLAAILASCLVIPRRQLKSWLETWSFARRGSLLYNRRRLHGRTESCP